LKTPHEKKRKKESWTDRHPLHGNIISLPV
jgi:hypothetical protein